MPAMDERLVLHCIDGDSRSRADLARAAYALGHHAEVYGSVEELAEHQPREGILLARDDSGPGGIDIFIEQVTALGVWLPVVATGEDPDTDRIVAAIKGGALDFLPLPIEPDRLSAILQRIAEEARNQVIERRRMVAARDRIASLSNRERQVLEWLIEGSSNKVIARELEISPRTVEIHRANMMTKLGARHAAEAVRLRMEARMEPDLTS